MEAETTNPSNRQKVSVVIPCYYSEKTIGKVVRLTREELVKAGYDYEFVLSNDGSTDGTFEEIKKLHEETKKSGKEVTVRDVCKISDSIMKL